jgi:hypothetical protein
MFQLPKILFFSLIGFAVGGLVAVTEAKTRPDVKLVLQITIDGLRGDLIQRYEKGFGDDGFRFLLSNGMADMPEYMTELGYTAGRLEPDAIAATANQVGNRLGIDDIVRFFYRPYLYLDEEKIAKHKADRHRIEQAIADALTDMDGIALAVAGSRLAEQPNIPLVGHVRNNHHVTRSGDIYSIQAPYWFLFDKGPVVAMHGSPWRYETHVPIIFKGHSVPPQTIHRMVHPVDVAPTIAAFLDISPPGAAEGYVLMEILN